MGVKRSGGGGQAPVNEPLGRQTRTALVETMLVAVTENETAELRQRERGGIHDVGRVRPESYGADHVLAHSKLDDRLVDVERWHFIIHPRFVDVAGEFGNPKLTKRKGFVSRKLNLEISIGMSGRRRHVCTEVEKSKTGQQQAVPCLSKREFYQDWCRASSLCDGRSGNLHAGPQEAVQGRFCAGTAAFAQP